VAPSEFRLRSTRPGLRLMTATSHSGLPWATGWLSSGVCHFEHSLGRHRWHFLRGRLGRAVCDLTRRQLI
jgi:hypothetical protein